MGEHIIDTVIKLATCNRCKAYVFACTVGGMKTTADPTPLRTLEDVRTALMLARSVHRVLRVGEKPNKLQTVSRGFERHLGNLVSDHDCGCGAQNVRIVEDAPANPLLAPVTRGESQDGLRPLPAPGSGSQGHTAPRRVSPFPTAKIDRSRSMPRSRALHANRRRSDSYCNLMCKRCGQLIGRDTNFVGIQNDNRWVWAEHADC